MDKKLELDWGLTWWEEQEEILAAGPSHPQYEALKEVEQARQRANALIHSRAFMLEMAEKTLEAAQERVEQERFALEAARLAETLLGNHLSLDEALEGVSRDARTQAGESTWVVARALLVALKERPRSVAGGASLLFLQKALQR
jgi:hypothetical protein